VADDDASLTNERLDEVIRDYLDARARGESPSLKELQDCHPDLASELAEFMANYEDFRVIGGEERASLTALALRPGERLDEYEVLGWGRALEE
jgi:hypothetical protein